MKTDKQLIVGVILCFVITIVFAGVIVWEIKKSIKHDSKVRKMEKKTSNIRVNDNRDFGVYETFVGDDAREMVLVPEGVFTRGSASGGFDEKPQMEVYLDAFYVDKYEVSVEAYNVFRRAADYIKPSVPFFQGNHKILETPSFPVVGVSWLDAVNYCKWAGKRLLSEAEWEKAARGTHGLIYPWGSKFLSRRANIDGDADGFQYMSPIGNFPMGRSVYGVYDMAGNASEWVADWYDQNYYGIAPIINPSGPEDGSNRMFRGGSWNARKVDVRAAKRFAANPGRKDSIIGFRCGRSKAIE